MPASALEPDIFIVVWLLKDGSNCDTTVLSDCTCNGEGAWERHDDRLSFEPGVTETTQQPTVR